MTQSESREAFEEWIDSPYDQETDPLWECWQASREALKQELLSDEMREDLANGVSDMLDNWRNIGKQEPSPREIAKFVQGFLESKITAKAALQAVVGEI